jgi:hypothetical protein
VSPDPATAGAPRRPALRVVSGDATPEEVAAILAVVAARSAAGAAGGSGDDSARTWSAHGYAHRHIRGSFAPGRHGWKTSYWPR